MVELWHTWKSWNEVWEGGWVTRQFWWHNSDPSVNCYEGCYCYNHGDFLDYGLLWLLVSLLNDIRYFWEQLCGGFACFQDYLFLSLAFWPLLHSSVSVWAFFYVSKKKIVADKSRFYLYFLWCLKIWFNLYIMLVWKILQKYPIIFYHIRKNI